MLNNNLDWFTIKEVANKIWAINDNNRDTIYLIEGNNKALLIDTGWGIADLEKLVSSITPLPVVVVFTHAHPDHTFGGFQFSDIYISNEDIPLLHSWFNKERRNFAIENILSNLHVAENSKEIWINEKLNNIIPIEEGYIFDLGQRKIKVIAQPGHSPGCICLLEETEGLLFTGDSILAGDSILLHFEESLPLNIYLDSLKHINSFINKSTIVFPSHGETPIDNNIVQELIIGITSIVSGKVIGTPHETYLGNGLLYKFNSCSLLYNGNNL